MHTFLTIPFDTSGPNSLYLLHGHRVIHMDLVASVAAHVADAYVGLRPGRSYTARQIMNQPYWPQLSLAEKKLVGSILADFVKHRWIQLVKVSNPGSYPNKYQLSEDGVKATPCSPARPAAPGLPTGPTPRPMLGPLPQPNLCPIPTTSTWSVQPCQSLR